MTKKLLKKFITQVTNLFIIAPLLASLIVVGTVSAQTEDLPVPGMLPDSPFYFLKSWSEGIGTFFTFGDLAKAERFANLAEVRLAEAKGLVEKGRPEIAEKAVLRYQNQLRAALAKAAEAKARGLDTDEVLAKVSEATLKHQAVLADVYDKVPEQAKPAIQRAMEAGMRGHEEALKAVSGEKREEIMEQVEEKRQEVEQRLEGLREKGIPVPEVPTREEIEERIPARPEERPQVPERSETPGRPEVQEGEREVEIPGGGGRPGR